MNTVRCRAMIASALSFVRPVRLAGPARPACLTGPDRQSLPDVTAIEPPDVAGGGSCPASDGGPIRLNSTEDRPPATSYSLIGW